MEPGFSKWLLKAYNEVNCSHCKPLPFSRAISGYQLSLLNSGSLMSCTQRPQNTAENSQGSPGGFMKSISCGDRHARARAGQVLCFV